jgi:predicted phage terminase large subunit-like protein
MTRWHRDDLAGRILRRARKHDAMKNWKVLRFQAIKTDAVDLDCDPRDNGEPLWPEHKSKQDLEAFKASMPPSSWSALFQGEPVTPGGQIVKRQWMQHRWDELPDLQDLEIAIVVDPKLGGTGEDSSDASMQLWAGNSERCYLLAEEYGRWQQTDTLDAIRAVWNQNECEHFDGMPVHWWTLADKIIIENKADGPSIKSHLKGEMSIPICLAKPWDSKTQRVRDITGFLKAGSVLFPTTEIYNEMSSLTDQAARFPKGDKDDRIDCAAYGVMYFLGDRLDIESKHQVDVDKNLSIMG